MTERRDETTMAERLAEFTARLLAGEPVAPADQEGLQCLVEMVARLHAAVVAPPPSSDFTARLREQALAELPAPQAAGSERLRELIARLLREEDFRRDFLASPEATLKQAGMQLTAAEMAALKALEPDELKNWMTDLDERINKSGLMGG